MRQLETILGGPTLFATGSASTCRVRVRERHLARSHRAARPAHARGPGRRGAAPGWRKPGRPVVATELRVDGGRITRLAFAQRDPMERRNAAWNQRLQVVVASPHGTRVLPVRLSGSVTPVPDAAGLPAPDFVLPTGGGIGYGGFVLDEASVRYLLANLPRIDDALTRGAAWVTLWEQMLDGRAAPAAILDLAMRALPARTRRAERRADTGVHAAGVLEVPVAATNRIGSRPASNGCCGQGSTARRPQASSPRGSPASGTRRRAGHCSSGWSGSGEGWKSSPG